MLKRRIAWIILIVFAAVMYLFDNGTASLALLITCAAAPLISLGLLLISGRRITASLGLIELPEGGHDVKLLIENKDIMPVSDVETEVTCTNLRTGESERIAVSSPAPPKRTSSQMLSITPGHAGRYEILVDTARIYDPLRIWSRKITVLDSVYITVLPETFDMDLTITSSSSAMPESDIYVDGRNGSDPGEVRGIREYIVGDPIKNIHWKLSAKTDKTLIKELGVPVTDQFLVILDNAADVGLNPDALDAIISVFASLIGKLNAEHVDFNAGWTDPVSGAPVFRRITSEEDMIAAADEYLSVPATTRSAFEVIERGMIDSRFVHLIMVGSQMPSGIDSITNGCQVTLLMYGVAADGRIDTGASIIGFDENTYKTELADIEV